jgi:ribonuclease HII
MTARADTALDRFRFEREALRAGAAEVAGVDEAGRGPLAGPVVAAAAMLPRAWMERGLPRELAGLNDSKQLSAGQREGYSEFLIASGQVRFAIARADVEEIDRINILQATHRAMREALAVLQPAHVLVDGLEVPALGWPQTAIVKGDALSYSIAAASVLAKVTRDRLMHELDRAFPGYGFAAHKGYGTPQHLAALARLGPCAIHRRSFAPLRATARQLELV